MSDWRELHRTDDLREAVGLATTIASMEFDVRWAGAGQAPADDDDSPGEAPYIIEVRAEDWANLREVLAAIADEQEEFDTVWTARRRMRELIFILVIVLLTLLPIVISMFDLFRVSGTQHEGRDGSGLARVQPPISLQFVRV